MTTTTPTLDRDSSHNPRESRPSRHTTQRLRTFARWRRHAARALVAVPLLLVVAADVKLRGDRLVALNGRYVASYCGAMIESAALWGLLLLAASSRRGAIRWIAAPLFVFLSTFSIGVQLYFHRQYATYLNLDATLFGTSLSESLLGQLRADSWNFLSSVAPPFLLAVALVVLARRVVRPAARTSRIARIIAPAVLVGVFLIPCSYRTVQASTPDVIYFHAIGGLLKQLTGVRTTAQIRPGLRSPPTLAPVVAAPTPRRRNVVFILTESVRGDVHCSAPTDDCAATQATNLAAPNRLPLLQMRSNASTTAVELAVLWSGLEPTASREDLHHYPLLFDYAHAAGIDDAYWTAHHMMFANSRLYVQDLPTSHQCGATDLDPLADIDLGARDDLLTARAERDLPEMKEPFFSVVHYGNTHVPYRVDPADAPFQPARESKSPSENEAYRNYYKNAVHLQDKTIAELVRFIRSQPFGDRTVIVFTSDHGEAFREHAQLCHTGSVYDEEIHVPFWIDAPPGTLTDSERASLVAARDDYHFHVDVTPTLLDLMGLYDAPQFATWRKTMTGASLLRPAPAPRAVPLTNCTGIWGCAFENWGMMRGSMKLAAREWDDAWRCYDVHADPREEHDLGSAACGDLVSLAERTYGGLPSAR